MTRYTPDPRTAAQIDRAFTYHAPKGDQAERYGAIREAARAFAMLLAELTPPGREQAMALTSLEQAVMAANAAIARGE